MTVVPQIGEPLVRVRGAVRHYHARSGSLHAVDGVDLDIISGETLAVVGESGSGKTTLARLILRLTELTSGTIVIAGMNLTTATGAQMRRFRSSAQIIFQDPFSSLDPRFKVGAIVSEGIDHLPLPERQTRVASILGRVGLSGDFANRFPHQLSGGQRQRVGIARALAVEPKLLVLDEPVSALDVSMQSQVLNLLAELRAQLGLTYLFISHDLGVVRHVADRIAVMYMGRIVELASTEDLFKTPQHPYTHALLSAIPSIGLVGRRPRIVLEGDPPSPIDPPDVCSFSGRCFRAREKCFATAPLLQAHFEGNHQSACHYPGPLVPGEAGSPIHSEEHSNG